MSLEGISRMWYYFRLGYGTYLTFLLGYTTTAVTVYYLAIKNAPILAVMFPNFIPFFVIVVLVSVPLAILAGWIHMKRSKLYQSEQDISVESNPYYYKLPPGYTREVYAPITIKQLEILSKLAEKNNLIDEKDIAEIDELKAKVRILRDGGIVS